MKLLIHPNSEDIIAIHDHLIEIYREEEFPIKIQEGSIYEGAIDTIVTRAINPLYGEIYFPHPLQKAAYYLYSLIVFHPFVDGNKRTALLTTLFFLRWNGFMLSFPSGTDVFLRGIATPSKRIKFKDVYNWIIHNTRRTIFDVIRGKILGSLYRALDPELNPFVTAMLDIYAFEDLPKFLKDIFRGEE